jgi:hypothetical protein
MKRYTRRKDRAMSLQGERLRNAIDRKHWVINSLLQTLHLTRIRGNTGRKRSRRRKTRPLPPKICTHQSQQVLQNQQKSEKSETVSKPTQANREKRDKSRGVSEVARKRGKNGCRVKATEPEMRDERQDTRGEWQGTIDKRETNAVALVSRLSSLASRLLSLVSASRA